MQVVFFLLYQKEMLLIGVIIQTVCRIMSLLSYFICHAISSFMILIRLNILKTSSYENDTIYKIRKFD